MEEKDKVKFSKIMATVADVYDKQVTAIVLKAFWSQLKNFEIDVVDKAFTKWLGTEERFPTPAGIKRYVPSENNPSHYGADEAWTLALKSMDESETVVLTDEIMQARAIAWETYVSGDKTGARMAFRDAYERLIEGAENPTWFVSLGHDPGKRTEAVTKAVEQGLLPKETLKKYRIEAPTVTVKQLTVQAAEKTPNKTENNSVETDREKDRVDFETKRKSELKKISDRLGYDINTVH
jgi:hypothetical protein